MFKKPRRVISKVFIHCSASDARGHDNVATIRRWHLARGFSDIGYHYIIQKDGMMREGRPVRLMPAAQKGHNSGSIAICVTGLREFTATQMRMLISLCLSIDQAYMSDITFHGHNEVNAMKSCPVFDYKTVLQLDADGHIRR